MKFCMKCRKGISDSSSYCPFCGGFLVDYGNSNDGSSIKTCKKCNKDFPPQYKYCSFCGGDLVDKDDSFWNSQETLGCINVGKKKRFVVEKTTKNGNGFISIGKQYFNNSKNDYQYGKSIAVPIECINELIEILRKA